MFWPRWSSRPAFLRKSFLPGFRESFRRQLTNTRRAAVYLTHKSESDSSPSSHEGNTEMSILWTIIIGFIAGVIAKFIMPGDNEPSGFILTTVLGIVGAFVAAYLGQALGRYGPGEGAGLIGAVVGAIIVLLVYGLIAGRQRGVV